MAEKLRIAITGANGMIGTILTEYFGDAGHELTLLVRRQYDTQHKLSIWKPYAGQIEAKDLEDLDVVIHLAGKSVASGRWTDKLKKELIDSRVLSAELLCKTLAKASRKPKLLISMSAVGYYGTHPPEQVIEESFPAGHGFLADLCVKWEAATKAAEEAGIRTIHLRTGIVLSADGGMLYKILPIFRAGIGGKLGNGEQVWSWVALDEFPSLFEFLIANESLNGPINNCSPNPVTNAEFTETLGKVMNRPTIMAVPGFAMRIAMGNEMAEETALKGARVVPKKLADAGYQFDHLHLEQALKRILSKD